MDRKWKIALTLGLIILIGLAHYSCQLYLVEHHQIHNVILKLFYIPIVMAAFWWGIRGGLAVGLASAMIYSIDVFRWRTLDSPLLYNDFAEMFLFVGIGLVLGWMVHTDRRCRVARVKAEARAEEEFRRSITDPLTHAFNRRFMDRVMKETWTQAVREGTVFSLLMIDLDRFKQINDRYGHPVGDLVLQATARAVSEQTRDNDLLFRYGGDEFLLILPRTDKERADCLARRLQDAMAKLALSAPTGAPIKAEFSIGVIQYQPGFNNIKEMLEKLDASLYLAKRQVDRVVLAG